MVRGSSVGVLILGRYDPDYPRQSLIKKGLERNGVTVAQCNCRQRDAKWSACSRPGHLLKAYIELIAGFVRLVWRVRCVIVAHNNHMLVPLAWLLTRIARVHLTVDAFDPGYRTAVLKGRSWMRTALLRLAEMVALKLADTILVATGEFGRLFAEDYHIPDDRIIVVPVGVDFERFTRSEAVRGDLGVFRVAYWGGFHPHHGVEVILEAAALLKDREEIEFILAGVGSLQPRFREKAEAMALANVRFAGYLTDEALIDVIAEADVCLGVFSTHVLARCSVTNKVFQAMSMSQPVITEDSPAVRAWFEHREHLYLVRPEDPAALSQAILVLQSDTELRRGLGKRARQHLERSFSVHAIGEVLLNELNLLDVAPGEAS